jgi:glucose/arabinose dehydrogenase
MAIISILMIGCSTLTGLPAPQITEDGEKAPSKTAGFDELGLEVRTLVADLDTPWDLVWGPDNYLWFTERQGRVNRVDPETGERRIIANLSAYERGESGLMGMAFHPDFEDNGYIYFSQSVRAGGRIINRLLRFRYNGNELENGRILIDEIPGNTYHDGSRLAFGPEGYLFMTTGDAGNARLAQDTHSLAGKILRVDEDGGPAPGNPFGNRIFSYGHRNPQGLVFNPGYGEWYITEHGPRDNDEVAVIRAGENHGWPGIHGFCDGDVSGETGNCSGIARPLAAWTPTIAPAGADFYDSDRIPRWRGGFLFTTLKGSSLIHLGLSDNGKKVISQLVIAEDVYGRLRDVLVGPDGSVYLATSNRDGRGRPAADDDRILIITPR